MRGAIRIAVAGLLAWACAHAGAAEIVLERSGVEKLVVQTMFKDRGRLLLTAAPCTAYLDQPSVTLVGDRVQIRTHLAARVGFVVNGDCAGVQLASWTTLSGRPVAAGGKMRLDDIRIDDVDDPDARALLANTRVAARLPVAVELDVRQSVQAMLAQGAVPLQATVDAFDFQDVAVTDGRLAMRFEFRLTGR